MAHKRFTDTEKWRDEWFAELPIEHKLIWLYLVDNCTNAGRWKKSYKSLNFSCESNMNDQKMIRIFGERLIDKGTYFFIPKFVTFQYPNGLNSEKKATKAVVKELQEYGLYDFILDYYKKVKGLIVDESVIDQRSIQETDKDTDKDKDKDTDKDGDPGDPMETPFPYDDGNPYTLITPNQFNKLIDKVRQHNIPDYGLKSMLDYYSNWIQEKILDHPNSKEYKNRSAYHNIIKWVISWWLKDGVKMDVPEKWKNAKFKKYTREDFNATVEK